MCEIDSWKFQLPTRIKNKKCLTTFKEERRFKFVIVTAQNWIKKIKIMTTWGKNNNFDKFERKKDLNV